MTFLDLLVGKPKDIVPGVKEIVTAIIETLDVKGKKIVASGTFSFTVSVEDKGNDNNVQT